MTSRNHENTTTRTRASRSSSRIRTDRRPDRHSGAKRQLFSAQGTDQLSLRSGSHGLCHRIKGVPGGIFQFRLVRRAGAHGQLRGRPQDPVAGQQLLLNAAGFHIDYSDQQLSTNLIVPPYRVPVTVPKTRINGAELESAYRMFGVFTLSGNLAYLQAKIADGTQSPKSPHWSGAVSGQLTQPLVQDWVLNAHGRCVVSQLGVPVFKEHPGEFRETSLSMRVSGWNAESGGSIS